MRLSELVGCIVFDATAAEIARVVDVRLVLDGPLGGGTLATPRVLGLVVGRGGTFARFGSDRHRLHGPWPVARLLDAVHRAAYFVPWEQVDHIDARSVYLSVERDALETLDRR